jgi:hypothetical protein
MDYGWHGVAESNGRPRRGLGARAGLTLGFAFAGVFTGLSGR